MTEYEQLKQKIVKHCPEIMELSFGCEVEYKPLRELMIPDRHGFYVCEGRGKGSVILWFAGSDSGSQRPYNVALKKKDIEILGHPITLEHVLEAIAWSKPGDDYKVSASGTWHFPNMLERDLRGIKWQFNKPLSEHSPETIHFLNQIIV